MTEIQKYIADVCYGGVFALFPDGTVRAFKDQDECLIAIQKSHRKASRKNKENTIISVITWNYRDRLVEEKVET